VWARLHAATGLRKADFEELELADIAALNAAVAERDRQEMRRDARLFALLCNLRPTGKKTWKETDFLPEEPASDQQTEEAREALEAYRARVANGRKGRRPLPG
jgi:hypothetical protein